jgi:carboxypeptidase family protein
MGRGMGLAFAAVRPGLVFVISLALPLTAAGQGAPTGTISIYILDPSGLAVPGGRGIVDIPTMAATRSVTSNGQGANSVPALMPGPCNLTTEADGFKTIRLDGVVIEAEQMARLDFTLTIGSKSDSITVLGSAPLFNTSDASVSTLIGNRFVENMPLNGRSFSSLIDLAPGVVLTPTNQYEQGQFSENGQRPEAGSYDTGGFKLVSELRGVTLKNRNCERCVCESIS